jgi:hypothetical protein
MEQYRQCTYNLTLRRVRATIVAVEKQWVLHILSVYVYVSIYACVACNALAPYYIVNCDLYGSTEFSHITQSRHGFRKRYLKYKVCVLAFFTTSVWNTSQPKNTWARYDHKCIYTSWRKVPVLSRQILFKTSFFETQFYAVCTVHHIAICRWTNKMHNFLQIIFIFLLCSTCFGRTTRPSSGAPSSKLYHTIGTFVL